MSIVPFRTEMFPLHVRPVDQDIMSLQTEMENLMSTFFRPNSFNMPISNKMAFSPMVDVKEEKDKYLVEAELPGMKENEINLDLHDNILTLKGERKPDLKDSEESKIFTERRFGTFRRDIPFFEKIDPDKVKASFKNGVLHIELMKKEEKGKDHRKIKIKH
jgi:HSP20 family protein